MNRQNKPKRNLSKSKFYDQNNYFASSQTSTKLSNCCPKNPPNISNHYKNVKKKSSQMKQVKYQYYGKENRPRQLQNLLQHSQAQKYERESRKTYHNLHQKKPTNFGLQSKSNIKSKVKQPIRLGKIKENKQNRQNKQKKNTTYIKQKKVQLSRTSYIAQESQCQLQCFQTLVDKVQQCEKYSSINQSRNSVTIESIAILASKPKIGSSGGNYKKLLHATKSSKLHSPNRKTPQQSIAEFQQKLNQFAIEAEQQSLSYMEKKDLEFINVKNLNCYLDNQIHFDWKKRALVINWMMSVISQSGSKRQTFANSVNIFDRYLSSTKNISIDDFQCIASSCMLIAAKLQDCKCFDAYYLSQSTTGKYSPQQICQQQYKILTILRFHVNTPTLNSWTNRLAFQWDMYLQNTDLSYYQTINQNLQLIKFKSRDQKSYYNFRWLFQYIDLAIMDIFTLRYQSRLLSLAFMYITLSFKLKLYTKQEIVNTFPYSSQFLKKDNEFNQFFNKFLIQSFSTSLFDLLPMIQYGATFAILSLKFQLPDTVKESQQQIDWQQFCSFQTLNQNNLGFLYKRDRNII